MITIYLDPKSKKPMYEQIYEYLRNEIRAEHLKAGEKLPSSRALSEYLEVSRTTVDSAYQQLVSEGYLESLAKRGYFVAKIEKLLNMPPIARVPVTPDVKKADKYTYDLSPLGADAQNFPDTVWRKLSREAISYDDGTVFSSSEPKGDLNLRDAINRYLRENRMVKTKPENIIIGAGSQYLMMILLKLFPANTTVAMENPCYMTSYSTMFSLGTKMVPVNVDEKGLNVDELEKSGADIAYVTPTHQFPTGAVMSVDRRAKLLNWSLKSEDHFIIEDDYDSEFRYQGKPIMALQSMDRGGKVIYMGTFSKVVSPAVRMSYMVLPDEILRRYDAIFKRFPSTVSRLDQAIMTRFLREGYFERHMNRLRTRYRHRHDAFIKALNAEMGEKIALSGTNAGSSFIMTVYTGMPEVELIEAAANHGVKLYSLSDFTINPVLIPYPQFVLGFGRLDESELKEAASLLAQAFKLDENH